MAGSGDGGVGFGVESSGVADTTGATAGCFVFSCGVENVDSRFNKPVAVVKPLKTLVDVDTVVFVSICLSCDG